MRAFERIKIDPNVANGLPCIRDTSITVSEVVKAIQGGKSVNEVIDSYEGLTIDDVVEAQRFAIGNLTESIGMARFDTAGYLSYVIGFGEIASTNPDILDKDRLIKLSGQSATNAKQTISLLLSLQHWSRFAFISDGLHGGEKVTFADFISRINDELKSNDCEIHTEFINSDEIPDLNIDFYFVMTTVGLINENIIFNPGKKIILRTQFNQNKWLLDVMRECVNDIKNEDDFVRVTNYPNSLSIAKHIYHIYNCNFSIKFSGNWIIFQVELPLWKEEAKS